MIKVILRDGGYYEITEKQIEFWERLYEGLNVKNEIEILRRNFEHKLIQRQTATGINKYINRHLREIFLRERYKI